MPDRVIEASPRPAPGAISALTVITVVRNGASHLEETMLSVLDYPADIDYIVIDGASTDGTLEIIERHSQSLRHWISEDDQGLYHAMNKGWRAARNGSFILYLGAGDRLLSLPDLARYRYDQVVYGTVSLGPDAFFRARAGFHLKLYNSLHHQALLINKALHPEPPFDTRFKVYADFDFNQRLMKRDADFVFAEKFRTFALPGGISDRSGVVETLAVIRKNFGAGFSLIALAGFLAMRLLPFLKRLRPFKAV